jgi:hypothetical protein
MIFKGKAGAALSSRPGALVHGLPSGSIMLPDSSLVDGGGLAVGGVPLEPVRVADMDGPAGAVGTRLDSQVQSRSTKLPASTGPRKVAAREGTGTARSKAATSPTAARVRRIC